MHLEYHRFVFLSVARSKINFLASIFVCYISHLPNGEMMWQKMCILDWLITFNTEKLTIYHYLSNIEGRIIIKIIIIRLQAIISTIITQAPINCILFLEIAVSHYIWDILLVQLV